MLVAPTELQHAPFRALTWSMRGSNEPEKRGCDFAFVVRGAWCGAQRKAIPDLIASVNDGRLRQEVQQMNGANLAHKLLVIEGVPKWSMDGVLLGGKFGSAWTREKHVKLLLSVQDAGVFVMGSSDPADTARVLQDFQAWARKGEHTSLQGRGPMVAAWGKKDNRDYQLHLIMGLQGVGLELAGRILDSIGMPFGLRVTREELLSVDGVGAKKADTIIAALEASSA